MIKNVKFPGWHADITIKDGNPVSMSSYEWDPVRQLVKEKDLSNYFKKNIWIMNEQGGNGRSYAALTDIPPRRFWETHPTKDMTLRPDYVFCLEQGDKKYSTVVVSGAAATDYNDNEDSVDPLGLHSIGHVVRKALEAHFEAVSKMVIKQCSKCNKDSIVPLTRGDCLRRIPLGRLEEICFGELKQP